VIDIFFGMLLVNYDADSAVPKLQINFLKVIIVNMALCTKMHYLG